MSPDEIKFIFAGFMFPRYIAELRLKAKPGLRCASPYYHAPTPLTGGSHPGTGFYLENHGAPGLRWMWADEIKGAGIRHTGWYSDEDQCGELIRGIVLRLPHARGFLAGWSMGQGMASAIEGYIYDDEIAAARAADSIAESTAESEREYQAKERERLELEEQEEDKRRDEMKRCFC